MTTFTDAERDHLLFTRGLTTDAQGREHLVGLTIDQTDWCRAYSQDRLAGRRRSREDRAKYLELRKKHDTRDSRSSALKSKPATPIPRDSKGEAPLCALVRIIGGCAGSSRW
jgi:hypothetical protein